MTAKPQNFRRNEEESPVSEALVNYQEETSISKSVVDHTVKMTSSYYDDAFTIPRLRYCWRAPS
jgi:hypothetical protein